MKENNGKRIGKLKKYWSSCQILFDGECLKDKIWNGKGFDEDNEVIFEIKDGKGTIKEYYDNDNIKFEGEINNGEKNGKDKEYNDKEEVIFIGEYLNDKRNGKGK